ncbi:hypothetical protein P775_00470 [Puniceibacterium antarcticum]|uniref:Uncharacterized protein n=1 Tax=Puniceibacterium antarcticum TaxID=1206336 RepID=A0A2G8RL73_9RHOB|nr:hypothetical protein [Puniceibacterium antarcticum]PIL22191.1 hypothetical protein P775_00470 [Puniceibacterium antarcticum]
MFGDFDTLLGISVGLAPQPIAISSISASEDHISAEKPRSARSRNIQA